RVSRLRRQTRQKSAPETDAVVRGSPAPSESRAASSPLTCGTIVEIILNRGVTSAPGIRRRSPPRESDVCVFLQSRDAGRWLDAFRVEPCHPGRAPGPRRPGLAGGTHLPEALLVEAKGGLRPAWCYIAPLDRRRRGSRLGAAARRLGAG